MPSLTAHTSRSTPSPPQMNTPMPPLPSVAAAGQATSSENDGDGIDGRSINNNNETNLHEAGGIIDTVWEDFLLSFIHTNTNIIK